MSPSDLRAQWGGERPRDIKELQERIEMAGQCALYQITPGDFNWIALINDLAVRAGLDPAPKP